MTVDGRRTLAAAGILIALATVCGAFGAHGLQGRLSATQLAVYETAVRYQFFHSLGLLGMGLAIRDAPAPQLRLAAQLVFAGIVLFSGSLYLLAFGAPRAVGVVTPIGGVALIGGWILFAVGVYRR